MIEEIGDEEDNRRSTMCVEYVYADNTRFLLSIAASSTDHQIKLVISRYEALSKSFPIPMSIESA